ncbi:hypothetical protein [Actinoplanes rectilineatus]|uniref:hypothetical protein n=1 Tax=Actinoplanes rectilineatus TaxID=113571 RepID=UPI000697BFF0|nr:hypothetical protein [Actinoplanes rectilineatus]
MNPDDAPPTTPHRNDDSPPATPHRKDDSPPATPHRDDDSPPATPHRDDDSPPTASHRNDDALLAGLRRVLDTADPTPEAVLAAADAAFETRRMDARLARLIADTAAAVRGDTLAVVRGAEGDGRMLRYADGDVHLDLEVHREGAALTLIGQLTGAPVDGLMLDRAGPDPGLPPAPVEADDLGRFVVTGVAPGPARLRCRTADGAVVLTEWMTL